jgi:hypothetical protein
VGARVRWAVERLLELSEVVRQAQATLLGTDRLEPEILA